ncbi:short-chain fatty acyl-CoA regulator family protein [Spirillospora sp. NBC_01491]|uniref:short-chain fatty acyl-CoA regulator family protein n=1 Tax=Spirillospora sp. NBC_01491 TaxID=2976007 RepID=UPI002E35F64A|nr:short-chain fatty acyl-CoA regulator family protein [Spirillospora sp. NBC_01491]
MVTGACRSNGVAPAGGGPVLTVSAEWHPGRILTQIAEIPDGRRYFWGARTVHRPAARPPGTASQAGPQVCERTDCAQRAFPGRPRHAHRRAHHLTRPAPPDPVNSRLFMEQWSNDPAVE